MRELVIKVPEGYEIDKEKSTFECVKFKPVKVIKTTEDLIRTGGRMVGYWVNEDAEVRNQVKLSYRKDNNNVFLSEKEAKSALAMSQISQLMPHYGGAITDEEWGDIDKQKYAIERVNNTIRTTNYKRAYCYLAFHTEEQRDSFLENNEQLVRDFLMIE